MINRTLILRIGLIFGLIFSTQSLSAQEIPPASPSALGLLLGGPAITVPSGKAIYVQLTPTGYRMYLNRAITEMLREALTGVKDEKSLATSIRSRISPTLTPEARVKIEMLAMAVQHQLPGFRTALGEKIGDNGVIVNVTGLPKKVKERPILKLIMTIALPQSIEEKTRKMLVVMRTSPLFWSVEPWQ